MSKHRAPVFHRNRAEDLLAYMRPIAAAMRLFAAGFIYDGRATPANDMLIAASTRQEQRLGTCLIFTNDVAHHSSGWLKNPDYERCRHLSISFWDMRTGRPRPFDQRLARLWAIAFFADEATLAWVESSKSPYGRAIGVQHWRVFCDGHWQPILPRGEVYSKQFTELGWKSASEVLEETGRIIVSPVDPS
jgi:hypothetical protein